MLRNILKSILLVVSFVAFLSTATAQNVHFSLVSSTSSEVVITAHFPNYETSTVNVNGETMQELHMENAFPLLKAGFPNLLGSSASIIIPEGSRPTAEIISSESQILHNIALAPSKGKLYRNVDPTSVSYQKGSAYNENRFLLEDTVALGEPYQLRDYYGIALQFFPFAYNPTQQALKVYKSITVRIRYNSTQPVKRLDKVVKAFDNIYSDHFLNYNAVKSNPLSEAGEILILSPEEFCSAMRPYADWKNKIGYVTKIVSLDSVGTNSSTIKTFISNYYNSHNPAFVLLVGDNTKFPTISVGGNVSDNYYGEIAGSDVYPDVIIGKISAETVEHVNTQVERFIQYEQNPPETSHFPVFMGIASSQGPGDNNEYDYDHIRNINSVLSNYTYTSGYELFEGSHGGLDASGDPTAANVSATVNNGVGIINYCGHGAETYWVTTNFNVNNINNLTNTGKLPFIISVACVNGAYSGRTCFAEAWMRATHNGQPSGAVSTLMSTINQPWNSPMCAQDHMNEYLTGSNGKNQQYTFGGIVFNGFIKMLDNYNDYEVTRTWILFGDPTLAVRTAIPEQLPLEYPEICPVGMSAVSFTSSVENAKVVVSKDNNIVAAGTIVNGTVTLDISSVSSTFDTLDVVAWYHNYIPYVGQLQIIPSDRPFVICAGLEAHDDNNNIPETGEFVTYDIKLLNVGGRDGNNVRTLVSTDDPYLSLYNNTATVNIIPSGDTVTIQNAFFVQVHADVPAFHKAAIQMAFIINNDTNTTRYPINLHAPELIVKDLRIDDSSRGNNNGKLDFNESVDIVVTVSNQGNATAKAGRVKMYCSDERLQLDTIRSATDPMEVGSVQEVRFTATLSPSVIEPTLFRVHTDYKVDHYNTLKMYYIKVGAMAETWESGDFSSFSWDTTGNYPWTIVNQNAYEGNFAAQSAQIGNNRSSSLTITNTCNNSDSISFYLKVSSEEDYDFLNFYIDNQLQNKWSGQVNWTRAAFFVPAGQHTFKWEYKKDTYMTSGQDKAWIDLIQFPINNGPTAMEDHDISDILVMPNPTTDVVRIHIDDSYLNAHAAYKIFDLSGRLLKQDRLNDNLQTIDLNSFTPGLYILKVFSNNQTLKTFKIVKQ